MCTAWYANLLQLRGAQHFQSLVRLPGARSTWQPKTCFRLPSASRILDECHGRLGAVTAFTLAALNFNGYMTRVVYYITLTVFALMFGIRSFVAIVTKRVSGMRRIAALQNAAGGTVTDKQRRQRTLNKLAVILIIDIVVVFVISCGLPLSYLVAGSFFSSRQLAVHLAVVLSLVNFVLIFAQVATHQKLKGTQRKARAPRLKHSRTMPSLVSSQASGLSVVEQSVVTAKGPGLFSEIGE
jgi:hypothetical protein